MLTLSQAARGAIIRYMKVNTVNSIPSGAYSVYLIFEKRKDPANSQIKTFLKENPAFGKLYETQILYYNNSRFLLVGAGKQEEFDFEKLQNWAGTAAKTLLTKTKSAVLILPNLTKISAERVGEAVSIGVELVSHDPTLQYKTKHEEKIILETVSVLHGDRQLEHGIEQGLLLANSINLARRLGDMPANEMTPTYFLNVSKKIARENKLKLTVLTEAQAAKKGMGAFTAVAKGSDEPSYFIALEYTGAPGKKEKWGFVGKGVTFDTGGLSLKRSEDMHEMKYDMSGAGTVLAAMEAISKLKPKTNIVGIMAVTENLPSGKSLKPGDIVQTYSGKTAEILDTDAEGRLVVLDAVAWAQKDFKATKIVDLATLTGAILIALGSLRAGLFTNSKELAKRIFETGEATGEKYWQMPMDKDYDKMIESQIADIANLGHGDQMGTREAGAISGAKFIEAAVDNIPWVHLDIAGVAWDTKPRSFRGVGATGFGIKTLVELASEKW